MVLYKDSQEGMSPPSWAEFNDDRTKKDQEGFFMGKTIALG